MILMSSLKIVSVYSRKQIMIEKQAIKSNRKIRKNNCSVMKWTEGKE